MILLLSFLLTFSSFAADSEIGVLKKGYSFTPEKTANDELVIDPVQLSADFGTQVDCGEISIDTHAEAAIKNISEQFAKIPGMLARSKNALALMAACQSDLLNSACENIKKVDEAISEMRSINISRCRILNDASPLADKDKKEGLNLCVKAKNGNIFIF